MPEVVADREGRGGEHPGARSRLDELPQTLGDLERRELQREPRCVGIDPTDAGFRCGIRELRELRGKRARAPAAGGGAGARAETLELVAEGMQGSLDRGQRLEEGIRQMLPLVAPRPACETVAQCIEEA